MNVSMTQIFLDIFAKTSLQFELSTIPVLGSSFWDSFRVTDEDGAIFVKRILLPTYVGEIVIYIKKMLDIISSSDKV